MKKRLTTKSNELQSETRRGHASRPYNSAGRHLVRTSSEVTIIADQKLDKANLFYESKSPVEENGREYAFSSELSLTLTASK